MDLMDWDGRDMPGTRPLQAPPFRQSTSTTSEQTLVQVGGDLDLTSRQHSAPVTLARRIQRGAGSYRHSQSRPTQSSSPPHQPYFDSSPPPRHENLRDDMDIDWETFSAPTREDAPVPGIPDQNVRALRKQFDTGARITELSQRMVSLYTKEDADPNKVKNILNYIAVEKGPVHRIFSSLGAKDLPFLTSGTIGKIVIDTTINKISPPEYFHWQLNDILSTCTRDKEVATRLVIAHFLVHAVLLARVKFHMLRLALHQEVPVDEQTIPSIGHLSGNLDFVSATIRGIGDLDDEMEEPNGGRFFSLNEPFLVVVEGKQSSTINLTSSFAELLGQMRTLMAKGNETGRTGVLTDGYEWRLFHLDSEYGLYQATLHAQGKDGRCAILGALTDLIAGRFPQLPFSDENLPWMYLRKKRAV